MRVFTPEHRKKLSDARRGRFGDEKHPQWKGDAAFYRAKHKWIERKRGTPRMCEKCKKVKRKQHTMHWASISRTHLRVLTDWLRLCAKCHGEFDQGKRKKHHVS